MMKRVCIVLAIATTIVSLNGMMQEAPHNNDQAILDKLTELQLSTAMQQISLLGIAKQMHPFTKMDQLIKIQNTLCELHQSTKNVTLKQKIMFALAAADSLQQKIGTDCPDALAWVEEQRKKSKDKATEQPDAPETRSVVQPSACAAAGA